MKKLMTWAMCFALAAASFTACNDESAENDGPKQAMTSLSGKISNFTTHSGEGDWKVKLVQPQGGNYEDGIVLSSANIAADGSFTISLPAPDMNVSMTIGDYYGRSESVYISNPDARFASAKLLMYDGDEYDYSIFYDSDRNYGGNGTDYYWADSQLVYVSSDVKVEGTYTYSDGERDIYSINAKAGWHILFEVEHFDRDNEPDTNLKTLDNPGGMVWNI